MVTEITMICLDHKECPMSAPIIIPVPIRGFRWGPWSLQIRTRFWMGKGHYKIQNPDSSRLRATNINQHSWLQNPGPEPQFSGHRFPQIPLARMSTTRPALQMPSKKKTLWNPCFINVGCMSGEEIVWNHRFKCQLNPNRIAIIHNNKQHRTTMLHLGLPAFNSGASVAFKLESNLGSTRVPVLQWVVWALRLPQIHRFYEIQDIPTSTTALLATVHKRAPWMLWQHKRKTSLQDGKIGNCRE